MLSRRLRGSNGEFLLPRLMFLSYLFRRVVLTVGFIYILVIAVRAKQRGEGYNEPVLA
jgi:hypothetical protein